MRQSEIPKQYANASFSDFPKYEKEVKEWYSHYEGMLTLCGSPGTGKTRMLYAIAIQATKDGKEPLYFRVPALLKELQGMCGESPFEEEKYLKELYQYENILLLDDAGTEKLTEFVWQDFYNLLLPEREQWYFPTVITTNLTLTDIAHSVGERVASRLLGGKVIKFEGKDRRQK